MKYGAIHLRSGNPMRTFVQHRNGSDGGSVRFSRYCDPNRSPSRVTQCGGIPTRGLAESEHGSEGPSDICRVLPGLDRALSGLRRLRNQWGSCTVGIVDHPLTFGHGAGVLNGLRFRRKRSPNDRPGRTGHPQRIVLPRIGQSLCLPCYHDERSAPPNNA